MKHREGFVSNSSSTSYIVALPKNFDITQAVKYIPDEILDDFEIDDREGIVNGFDNARENYGSEILEVEDYGLFGVLEDMFKPFIIAAISVSSDEGVIHILTEQEIAKINKIRAQQ